MSARKLRLEVTEQVTDDLRSIEAYTLAQWGTGQASEYEAGINKALEMLRTRPGLGNVQDNMRGGVRSLPVLSHVVLYRVEGDTAIVLRILHRRMDISRAALP